MGCYGEEVPNETRRKKRDSVAKARSLYARPAKRRPRAERAGKVSARTRARRHAAGAVESVRELPPLGRLLAALEAEKIKFILIEMFRAGGRREL